VATGHADRSGPTNYNQRLSERRAEAVKSALVREGVPGNIIQTSGRGENENLVATADGVREPRNRRVEIVFR
jgi:outer membrane protein OmpA-like peptidoglycan-associated protein